jgi:hypothetical protein
MKTTRTTNTIRAEHEYALRSNVQTVRGLLDDPIIALQAAH